MTPQQEKEMLELLRKIEQHLDSLERMYVAPS